MAVCNKFSFTLTGQKQKYGQAATHAPLPLFFAHRKCRPDGSGNGMEVARHAPIICIPFASEDAIQGFIYSRCLSPCPHLQESPHLPGITEFEHFNHRRDGKTETAAAETFIRQDQMRASNATRNGSAPSRY
jgi:hypothetical protein